MLGRHPIEKMPDYYALADAMLFSLKDEYIFSITIPAKVQSYLACGKPILAMINGEANELIRHNGAGLGCRAGDAEGLANNVLKFNKMNTNELSTIGENSYNCYKKYFKRDILLDHAEVIFKKLIL